VVEDGTIWCLAGASALQELLLRRPLVTGNWELGHVPRSGNIRSVPGTWEQSHSSSVKS
jgi:hypothetical protein